VAGRCCFQPAVVRRPRVFIVASTAARVDFHSSEMESSRIPPKPWSTAAFMASIQSSGAMRSMR
jgi:hypothetical protein